MKHLSSYLLHHKRSTYEVVVVIAVSETENVMPCYVNVEASRPKQYSTTPVSNLDLGL